MGHLIFSPLLGPVYIVAYLWPYCSHGQVHEWIFKSSGLLVKMPVSQKARSDYESYNSIVNTFSVDVLN